MMNNNSNVNSKLSPPPPSLQSLIETHSNSMKLWDHQTPPTSMRKLTRTDSTYEDDSFDESTTSMRDTMPSYHNHLHHHLGHLNHRHHVLRQQWFSRKNNNNNSSLVNRLRRTASNSSSSSSLSSSTSTSSGISSANIYSSSSSSSNNVNSTSFASSFSSSFSATLSSLSESCDQQSLSSCDSPIPATSTTIDTNNSSICDYPKILRKSSFKNKFIHCYKPYNYGKPTTALTTNAVRRYSLQLHLKNNNNNNDIESLLSSSLMMISPTPPSRPNSRSSMKNSSSCHQIAGHYNCHHRDRRCIWATMAAMAAAASTSVSKPTPVIKSNPSSPSKNSRYLDSNFSDSMNEEEEEEVGASILIDTDSSSPQQPQQQPIGGDVTVTPQLVRSKSLDDLQTLFCCPNLCTATSAGTAQPVAPAVPISGLNMENVMLSSLMTSIHQPTTMANSHSGMIHYSSFNPIPCDPSSNTTTTETQPKTYDILACPFFSQQQQPQQLNPDHPYQSLNPLMMKMTSISSNQINIIGGDERLSSSTTIVTNEAHPTDTTNNHSNNNNDSNNCDIDHVMRKISSLHV